MNINTRKQIQFSLILLIYSIIAFNSIRHDSLQFTKNGAGGTTTILIPDVKLSEFYQEQNALYLDKYSAYLSICKSFDRWISQRRFITVEEFNENIVSKDIRCRMIEQFVHERPESYYSMRLNDFISDTPFDMVC